MSIITFTKVNLPGGWMSNMSPHPIEFGNRQWNTAEALFQALRFVPATLRDGELVPLRNSDGALVSEHRDIIMNIWRHKSPMGAKIIAKAHRDQMVVDRYSPLDLTYMRHVLRLKLQQHPKLLDCLIDTGDATLVEDVTRRMGGSGLFWGAALLEWGWIGENWLGKLWMELRDQVPM